MKRVEIHDTYKEIKDKDGVVLHPFFIETNVIASDLTDEAAKEKVIELFEDSKQLGSYNLIDKKDYIGYVDMVITFIDGKVLKRIIYTIE